GIGAWEGIVEKNNKSIPCEAFQGPFETENQASHRRVVLPEDRHHLLGLRGLGEGGEPAQIAGHDGDLPPVALQKLLVTGGDDELGKLGGDEAPQSAVAIQLGELLLHALLEFLIPLRKLRRL